MTFTDQEARAAMGALDETLRKLFSGNSTLIKESSDAVASLIAAGEFPMVNMWVTLMMRVNPDMPAICGILLAAMTHQGRTLPTIKQ